MGPLICLELQINLLVLSITCYCFKNSDFNTSVKVPLSL